MTRLSKLLFTAAALIAVPLNAFAEGEPAAPDPAAGGGGDGTGGTGDGTMTPPPPVEGGGTAPAWSKSIIDRPLTVLKGKLGAQANLLVLHIAGISVGPVSSPSVTVEGLQVGASYGISDKLAVGGSYFFALHDFEIKGTLQVFGAFQLMHSDKLDVGASAELDVDLNGTDAMGGSTTELSLAAGLGVRYKVTPKIGVYTGSPIAPGPLGQHLKLGLTGDNNKGKSFDIPVGAAMQVTPELYAFLETNIANINLGDVPMGGSRVTSIADYTPLTLGAFFNVNKNIDVGGSFNLFDLQNAGDVYTIILGARYFN